MLRVGRKKQIRVKCLEPFTRYPRFEQPWSDVWLSWKERPGRPRVRKGPTLIGRGNVMRDLEYAARRMEDLSSLEGVRRDREHLRELLPRLAFLRDDEQTDEEYQARRLEMLREDIEHAEKILRALEDQDFVVELLDPLHMGPGPCNDRRHTSNCRRGCDNVNIPNVYTRRDTIDRAEAERLIRRYLATLGIRNASLRWGRPPRFLILPT